MTRSGKSKPPRDITPHLLEWLQSKRQEISSVGEGAEERESPCTVGGNVDWCGHCKKQYGAFSENYK